MAVALFVHERDGDGLSHAFALARALPADLAPAIFCGDPYPERMNRHVPGLQITDAPTLAFELRMYARRTTPAVVVAVGRPVPCDVGADVQQLVVDPDVSCNDLDRLIRDADDTRRSRPADRSVASTAGRSPRDRDERTSGERSPRRRLAIRVDDVTEASDELLAICELCADRRLRASLEVIPYLCRIDEQALGRVTPHGFEFEVSQHGYAHLPRRCDGRKAEFVAATGWRDALTCGSRRLLERFPKTFTFGFSAPYDFYPPGLTRLWADIGGRYVSVIWAAVEEAVPAVRLTDDPWDWARNAPRPNAAVVANVERSFARAGSAGLVLHPQPLSVRGERERLGDILDAILEGSCESSLISELAVAAASTTSP
jgi:hypothetical protein